MREVGAAEMADIARGAALMGTGGGGDPTVGRLLAQEAVRRSGPVRLVEVADVPADAVVVSVAMMGAPTVMVEKLPSGEEVGNALRALQAATGEAFTHLACIEAGGINSMIPFAAAAETGLPLVDADGMGRAFPELHMVLPTLHGIAACPMCVADDKGNTVVVRAAGNRWAERLARASVVEMGCSAITAQYVMRGHELDRAMVPGTLTRAERIGRAVRAAQRGAGSPTEAAARALGGRILFSGKVRDVERRTAAGFARGTAVLDGVDEETGRQARIDFQNENLVLRLDGTVVASVPDLICVADSETGEPMTTERLRYGSRVRVIGAPCDPRWRSTAGLELVGPRALGYDHAYVPVEHCWTADR